MYSICDDAVSRIHVQIPHLFVHFSWLIAPSALLLNYLTFWLKGTHLHCIPACTCAYSVLGMHGKLDVGWADVYVYGFDSYVNHKWMSDTVFDIILCFVIMQHKHSGRCKYTWPVLSTETTIGMKLASGHVNGPIFLFIYLWPALVHTVKLYVISNLHAYKLACYHQGGPATLAKNVLHSVVLFICNSITRAIYMYM